MSQVAVESPQTGLSSIQVSSLRGFEQDLAIAVLWHCVAGTRYARERDCQRKQCYQW